MSVETISRWRCDKCRTSVEAQNGVVPPTDWVRVKIVGRDDQRIPDADLCHRCQSALRDWLAADGSPDP